MKRLISIFALSTLLLSGTAIQAQLLWKISGNGLAKPSYILGISQYAPMETLDEIPGLRAVYEATEQVCGVVAVTDSSAAPKFKNDLPQGVSFQSLYNEPEQQFLLPIIKKLYDVDIEKTPYCNYTPLMLSIIFEFVDFWSYADVKHDFIWTSQTTFSDSLQHMAISRGIPVKGLVSNSAHQEYLFKHIYTDMPLKQQKKLLINYFLNFSKIYNLMAKDIEAYQTRNLDTISQNFFVSPTYRKSYKKTFSSEIQMWAGKIPPVIKERSTLVILPVYALIDWKKKASIMEQLRKRGYTVEAVE